MNRILEDFYYGNLAPADQHVKKGSPMAKEMDGLVKCESYLLEVLEGKEQRVFEEFTEHSG